MKYLNKDELAILLPYFELIKALKKGFREGGNVPLRHLHDVKTKTATNNSLLIMPCWQPGGMIGVKMTMVCPDNHLEGLETIQSSYILSDATTGVIKAVLNGDELTFRRTAAASALASSLLSRSSAKKMLMMGTGKLAPHLISAHASVRNLTEIYIWGRRHEQAEELAHQLENQLPAKIIAVDSAEKYANICDIICCATFAKEPILKGKWLNKDGGQHIDLVGSYKYDMREADNEVISSSNIYVDTMDGALAEAGDILQPIDQGIISRQDIKGDLFDLVAENFKKPDDQRTTLFKSVGTALEDLIAAKYAYQKLSAE